MLFRKKVSDHKPKPEDELWGKAPQLIFWFYVLSKTWFAIELL
ncbi:MAG: hypothetical protein ACK5YH_03170 [Pseudanabaena sp.]|jgi:hypothetical protein|nr:hypothetical protein [Pseudanabaena mucicola]